MSRTDALDAFIAVLNTATPEHPAWDNPFEPYPASRDQIEFGVTRSAHASCGARSPPMVAGYSTRMSHINQLSRAEHLALLTHEISHIVVGRGVNGHTASHPTAFWREMAFHALEVRDAIRDGILEPVFGQIDADEYLIEVANNPNAASVDHRSSSVPECRQRMRELLQIDDRTWCADTSRVIRLLDE